MHAGVGLDTQEFPIHVKASWKILIWSFLVAVIYEKCDFECFTTARAYILQKRRQNAYYTFS